MPPSAIFYNESLEPCARNGVINWTELPNKRLPLAFIGNDTHEESVDEVRELLWRLLAWKPIDRDSEHHGIMTAKFQR